MGTVARVALKLVRFEVGVLLLVAISLTVANVVVAAGLMSIDVPLDCLTDPRDAPECAAAGQFFALSYGVGDWLVVVATALPFVMGVVLGAPLVAGEIENRTATFTWSLDPSRTRWFYGRLGAMALVLVVFIGAVAGTAHFLEVARRPELDAWASFDNFGGRGLPLIARGLAVMATGALVGATLGRLVPAILVTAILAVALFLGVTLAQPIFGSPVAVATDQLPRDHLVTGVAYRQGSDVFSQAEIDAMSPEAVGSREYFAWREDNYETLVLALPPREYPRVMAMESLSLVVLAGVACGLTAAVVARRRPYA